MPIRPLPAELQQKAISELNENPKRIEADINHLREWATKHPYLKIRTDDQWLLSFLRGCKFSLQSAKEKLDVYYSARSVLPELFTNRNPFSPELRIYFKSKMVVILPNEGDPLAPTRFLMQTNDSDPDELPMVAAVKATFMVFDMCMNEDAWAINGQEIIYDFQKISYGYMGQITPKLVKIYVTTLVNGYPSRLKGIYFINMPSFFYAVVNLAKQLVSEKIRSRMHFYTQNNMEEFYSRVPLSVLPEEYGGSAGPLREMSNKLRLKTEGYNDWFKEDSKYGCDESKRPERHEFVDDEGSFRQLDID